ncbi:hypothetical protein [Saccharopolyspora thermophila]|uniref:DUF2637 domain-containing protein n=1 Tax=Saccharopolyspora thermophila TaxID=89367 RepID=A0ABN1C1D4_9PSEU
MGLRRTRTKPGTTRRVRKLGDRISEARQLRGLVRDPDLNAVEMERQGRRTLTGLWFFLSLGLVFTTAGVQRFLAGDATTEDPLWWAAWTVEPMFAGLLITVLNFEAVILSYGIQPDHDWWRRLKRVLLTSTLAMNVIPQVMPLIRGQWETFNPGSAAVHAIIPVIVYGIAEVIPVIQARQRQVLLLIYQAADTADGNGVEDQADEHDRADVDQPRPVEQAPAPAVPAPAQEPPAVSPPRVPGTALRLPPDMLQAVKDAYTRAASEGRELTTADVRRAARVPEQLAEKIVAELRTHNGHAFA